ncbi:MAG TPA: DUF3325 domain-containing protein [Polyangiaceae bacterium]|nr:DUF3325 domain-containing protein [Polyangiaceae bacterium]
MAETALVALAFASSYLGFALIALTQKPHHGAVSASRSRSGLPLGTRRRGLAFGSLALAGSFAASLAAEGPSFGTILWVLCLGSAALGVMFTLTYRPHWLRGVQRALAPVTPA